MGRKFLLESRLKPYQPQLPLEQLVVKVNNVWHDFEARDYKKRHTEVYQQLPPIWKEITNLVKEDRPNAKWNVLDFGCGTGFASEQVLRNLSTDSIAGITCYDLSAGMLEKCRLEISPLFQGARFCNDENDISAPEGQAYNLLLTNSLLHHLPDPYATIEQLLPLLSPDAIWVAGHEPSIRFHQNPECAKLYASFLQKRRWQKFFTYREYWRKIKQLTRLESNPPRDSAKEAFRKGWFKKRPPARLMGQLVDYHVVRSQQEIENELGFDFETMQQRLKSSWQLRWFKSYSFMGHFYEERIAKSWRLRSRELAHKHPKDGANFCTVWQRL